MDRLRRPRLRVARATAHRATIAKVWHAFLESEDAYETVVRIDGKGHGSIAIHPSRAIPLDEISLEFGELLYQLRASLDSLVYELAIIESGQDPPPDAERLEFPFRTTQKAFDAAGWKIAPLSEHHRLLINRLQPFAVAGQTEAMAIMAQTLHVLHDWARKDRHRGLHAAASWAANRNPLFDLPDGCDVDSLTVTRDGPLESDATIATFHVAGWQRGMELAANPNVTIDLGIDEPLPALHAALGGSADDDTLSQLVKLMIIVVDQVIRGFEETLG